MRTWTVPTMTDYNPFPYIHREPRTYDQDAENCETCTDLYGDVCAKITWTPREGAATTVTGPYLDGCRDGSAIVLSCGIEALLTDLDLWPVIAADDRKRWTICDLVNRQLEHRPWAVLTCPEGRARLELLRHG